MNELREQGVMVSTPSQDYDDSYCIQHARAENAFIVTNDKFRDYLKKLETNPQQNEGGNLAREKAWLKQHCISFTFKQDEFLPNPDSKLFSRFPLDGYNLHKS